MSIEFLQFRAGQRKAMTDAMAAVARGELPPLPPLFEPLMTEVMTYFRALSQLIADGEEGRVVVLRGDQIDSIWDTYWDARQFGCRVFEDGRFLIVEIDPDVFMAYSPHFERVRTVAEQSV